MMVDRMHKRAIYVYKRVHISAKEPISPQKSPMFLQKIPMFLQRAAGFRGQCSCPCSWSLSLPHIYTLSHFLFLLRARDSCSVLQCVAVCCSVLQCVAVCCSVLQFVAVCCSVLQCVETWVSLTHFARHEMWQCVAVCCGVLRCVAVCVAVFLQ